MDRRVRIAIFASTVLVGWLFIAWQNKFHISPPLVFVCLGYLAVVSAVYNLWRTGAAMASIDDARAASSWGAPIGGRAELEREKKTLLKAIKEAEFDHQMGKLSKADADHMISVYRARAIELIKALEHDGTTALSVREKIEREVRARLEVDQKTKKKASTDVVAENKKLKKTALAKAEKAEAKAEKAGAKVEKAEPRTAEAKVEEAEPEAKPDDVTTEASSTMPAPETESAAKEATP